MPDKFFLYVTVMAGVTYLIRMLPLALVKKKLENRFIRSFLFYIPYAVLGAMTFPSILYSTSSLFSAILGLIAAIILAYREKSLLTVAGCACTVVLISESFLRLVTK